MERTRLPALLAALVSGLVLASGVAAAPVKDPNLPAGWSHAEINVTIKGVPHTKIYDRGVITVIAGRSLTLEEADGSVVTIQVALRAKITLRGKPVKLSKLRVGYTATTLRIDGGPAVGVTAVPPKKTPPPKSNPVQPEKPAKPETPANSGNGNGPRR
jgi:hypothetical protein